VLSRESAGEHSGHGGQKTLQGQMQDSGEVRSADQDALNLDSRTEYDAFLGGVHDEAVQVTIGDLELHDVSLGKLEGRGDREARVGNVGELAIARPSRVSQPGNVDIKVGRKTIVEAAFHKRLIDGLRRRQ
jgi:hypothetical protein